MRVSLVPTEAVGHVWKDVDRVLKKAVATVDNKAEMIDILDGIYDGSGVDDMVPATLEGEQDVLLSDGEFVLRKKTTDALEKAYGGGFLDIVNRAEEDAPEKLQQMVG